MLDGIPVEACPDTGSCINGISYDLVKHQNWTFHRNFQSPGVKLPGNGFSRLLGTIELPWQFDDESTVHKITFSVLSNCVHPVILGRKFLRSSKSLTEKFIHRIKEKVVQLAPRNRLFLLGFQRDETWGTINNHNACALADTGSDVMVMSLKFAKSHNLYIETALHHREWVQLADGSTIRTKGKVLNAGWSFNGDNTKYYNDFVVLDGIDYDVILSNDFLFGNRVFSRYGLFQPQQECSYQDVEASQLNLIKRIVKPFKGRVVPLPNPALQGKSRSLLFGSGSC